MHASDRSEGLDLNGICYPCVMGWGLAGTGNSSAAVAVAVAIPPKGGGVKITKTRVGLKKQCEKIENTCIPMENEEF